LLKQYLRCFTANFYKDWLTKLVSAEFAQNNSVYYTTCISPFENLYRFNPEIRNLPIWDKSQEERVLAATERARDIQATSKALKKR